MAASTHLPMTGDLSLMQGEEGVRHIADRTLVGSRWRGVSLLGLLFTPCTSPCAHPGKLSRFHARALSCLFNTEQSVRPKGYPTPVAGYDTASV